MPDSAPQHQTDATFERTDAGAYRFGARDILRWGDADAMGHINNVMFARFFESARIAFMTDLGRGLDLDSDDFLLAHLSIDFLAEMRYPGEVWTGIRTLRVGRASVRLAEAIFLDGRCTATGDAVLVRVDPASGRSVAIPESMRARLLHPPD